MDGKNIEALLQSLNFSATHLTEVTDRSTGEIKPVDRVYFSPGQYRTAYIELEPEKVGLRTFVDFPEGYKNMGSDERKQAEKVAAAKLFSELKGAALAVCIAEAHGLDIEAFDQGFGMKNKNKFLSPRPAEGDSPEEPTGQSAQPGVAPGQKAGM